MHFAVVIANGAYTALGTLPNPVNDGRLVAAALAKAGFTVKILENQGQAQFRLALQDIDRESRKADVTLIYYAGHGAQIDGVNFLIPVDVPAPQSEAGIRFTSIQADEVLSAMNSPYKVLILDACRDNPILGKALSKGRGAYKRGLARIELPADTLGGIYIAYSTSENEVADDGSGADSPFAAAFAANVGKPVSITDMFSYVTRDVMLETRNTQRPFSYSSLPGLFCLTGNCGGESGAAAATDPSTAAAPVALAPPATAAASSGDAHALAATLKRLNATKAPEARARIEQALWEQLRSHLPNRLAIGWEPKAADGSIRTWAIDPVDAVSDAHKAKVSEYTGQIANKAYSWSESLGYDLSVDCDRNATATARYHDGNNVQFFSLEQQRAAMKTPAPETGLASAVGLLCNSPMRFIPIWVADSVPWIDIGDAYQAAPSIRYRDPAVDGIWYLFVRNRLTQPKEDGGVVIYYWFAANCHTHESEWGRFMSADPGGKPLYLHGTAGKWTTPAAGSPAANSQVILCDQGADY